MDEFTVFTRLTKLCLEAIRGNDGGVKGMRGYRHIRVEHPVTGMTVWVYLAIRVFMRAQIESGELIGFTPLESLQQHADGQRIVIKAKRSGDNYAAVAWAQVPEGTSLRGGVSAQGYNSRSRRVHCEAECEMPVN